MQVNLLEWLAKELSGWDYFAPVPRGKPDPAQVLLSIHAAHKLIADYEWAQTAPEGGWLDDPAATVGEVSPCSHLAHTRFAHTASCAVDCKMAALLATPAAQRARWYYVSLLLMHVSCALLRERDDQVVGQRRPP